MRLIAGLLSEFLGKTGGIQAFLIRHISCAKVSVYNGWSHMAPPPLI